MTEKKFIKNRAAIITGSVLGIIAILFLNELFQGLLVYLFWTKDVYFIFSVISLKVIFNIESNLNWVSYVVIYLSPIFFSLIMMETGSFVLNKTSLGFMRYSTILFVLINVGFVIINLFYGAFSVILNLSTENDWVQLAQHLGFSEPQRIIFMFFCLMVLIGYLNYLTKRIIKYINA